MSNQLKAELSRCVFRSVLKLVRDEADLVLLGREFHAGFHSAWLDTTSTYYSIILMIAEII